MALFAAMYGKNRPIDTHNDVCGGCGSEVAQVYAINGEHIMQLRFVVTNYEQLFRSFRKPLLFFESSTTKWYPDTYLGLGLGLRHVLESQRCLLH